MHISFISPVIVVYLRSAVSWIGLETVWQDHDMYCGLADDPDEAVWQDAAEVVDMYAVFKEDQL